MIELTYRRNGSTLRRKRNTCVCNNCCNTKLLMLVLAIQYSSATTTSLNQSFLNASILEDYKQRNESLITTIPPSILSHNISYTYTYNGTINLANIFGTESISSPTPDKIFKVEEIIPDASATTAIDTMSWNSFLYSSLLNVTKAVLHEHLQETILPVPTPFDWNKAILNALANVSHTVNKQTNTLSSASPSLATITPTLFKQQYSSPITHTNHNQILIQHIMHTLKYSPSLLTNSSKSYYQHTTSNHIYNVLLDQIILFKGNHDIVIDELSYTTLLPFIKYYDDSKDFSVNCYITNQNTTMPLDDRQQRLLDSNDSSIDNDIPLSIIFDCYFNLLEYDNTTIATIDQMTTSFEAIIINAFTSNQYKSQFINTLNNSMHDVFLNVIDLDLYIDGQIYSAPVAAASTHKEVYPSYKSPGAVVGYTLASVFLVFSILFTCYKIRNKRLPSNKKSHKTEPTGRTNGILSTSNHQPPLRNRIIQLEVMEDISTIGDPAFFDKKESMTEEGGYSVDYDYTGAFKEVLTTVSSVDATGTKTSRSAMITTADFTQNQSSILSEKSGESSFEEQYRNNTIEPNNTIIIQVDAPSGKLGLIIDTPNGGIPMVQAMKHDSVLNHKVKVGDLLVSVDGIDTRRMSASRVSQLISLYSGNPSRKLVFVRNNHWL